MHKHACLPPPTNFAVYTFSTSPSCSLWKVNKNQMSAHYVGEMVHNKKNRKTGKFSTEKAETAIPHQAFHSVTHKHRGLRSGFDFTFRCQLSDPS